MASLKPNPPRPPPLQQLYFFAPKWKGCNWSLCSSLQPWTFIPLQASLKTLSRKPLVIRLDHPLTHHCHRHLPKIPSSFLRNFHSRLTSTPFFPAILLSSFLGISVLTYTILLILLASQFLIFSLPQPYLPRLLPRIHHHQVLHASILSLTCVPTLVTYISDHSLVLGSWAHSFQSPEINSIRTYHPLIPLLFSSSLSLPRCWSSSSSMDSRHIHALARILIRLPSFTSHTHLAISPAWRNPNLCLVHASPCESDISWRKTQNWTVWFHF